MLLLNGEPLIPQLGFEGALFDLNLIARLSVVMQVIGPPPVKYLTRRIDSMKPGFVDRWARWDNDCWNGNA